MLSVPRASSCGMAPMSGGGLIVEQFPCLKDNYGFLVHDEATGATAAVDTPEVGPIMAALERRGWTLTHILNTHYHADHAGGNAELVRRTGCKVSRPPRASATRSGRSSAHTRAAAVAAAHLRACTRPCKVVAPALEVGKIGHVDLPVSGGDRFEVR